MTTTVKVSANCASDTEVQILVLNGETVEKEVILQNGEVHEASVYDAKVISVMERHKAAAG